MKMIAPTPETERKKTAAGKRTRILLVDEHPAFRRGTAALLQGAGDLEIVAEAGTSAEAIESIERELPDVVLLDISMPGQDGINAIKQILGHHPNLPLLVVSTHEASVYALRTLRAGAKGYLMKTEAPAQLLPAIRRVSEGRIYVSPEFSQRLIFKAIHSHDDHDASPVDRLSDRELEVLQLFGKGENARDIAKALHLSIKTIETHRMHIKEKLGFQTADEMVQFAIDWVAHQEG